MKTTEYIFCFDAQKNEKLRLERGISFEEVIEILLQGLELDILEHHNQKKYPLQKIFVLEKDNDVYVVPYVEGQNGEIFLKTIFPHRKLKEKYRTQLNGRQSKVLKKER